MSKLEAGWRKFTCETCKVSFEESTRDWQSPSLSSCPYCHADVFPESGRHDAELLTDHCGNLVDGSSVVINAGK